MGACRVRSFIIGSYVEDEVLMNAYDVQLLNYPIEHGIMTIACIPQMDTFKRLDVRLGVVLFALLMEISLLRGSSVVSVLPLENFGKTGFASSRGSSSRKLECGATRIWGGMHSVRAYASSCTYMASIFR